ncbi:unnamed protein product [Prunus armeniaca]
MSEQVNNTSDGKLFELGAKLRRENSNRFTVGLKKCKKVEIWDSLLGSQYNAGRYQLVEKIGWQFAKFNIVRSDKARRQLNGCDCGIFVMNWLEDIECKSHGSNKFQHASEQVRIALSLLKNPKNTRLKEVREFARRVVDEELDKFAELCPFIPHHPIARKKMIRSQAK